jgi:hypothetical protein
MPYKEWVKTIINYNGFECPAHLDFTKNGDEGFISQPRMPYGKKRLMKMQKNQHKAKRRTWL